MEKRVAGLERIVADLQEHVSTIAGQAEDQGRRLSLLEAKCKAEPPPARYRNAHAGTSTERICAKVVPMAPGANSLAAMNEVCEVTPTDVSIHNARADTATFTTVALEGSIWGVHMHIVV